MQRYFDIVAITATAALLPLLAGCSQNAVRSKAGASAPGLSGEERARLRGVSDPNAPFLLIDRSKTAASSPGGVDDSAGAELCQPGNLKVYETAASMNGESRVVRLAIKNSGKSVCRLSGYPAIELQGEDGAPVAGIAIRQTGAASLIGTVVTPIREASQSSAVKIVLRPGAEANFEVGWSTGEGCPLVSKFEVGLPREPAATPEVSAAGSGVFTISHALSVCGGELQVTALRAGGAA